MKRIALFSVLLCGCASEEGALDGGVDWSDQLDQRVGVELDAEVMADAGAESDGAVDGALAPDAGPEPDATSEPDAALEADAAQELDAALEPDACRPACAAQACGPDGCGGVCGVCEGDARCEAGQCLGGQVSMLPDPGLSNPRLRFHTGGVANNAPELFEAAPDMPDYPVSQWFIAQWAKTMPGEPAGTGVMRPELMFENAASTEDALFGVARWAFPGGPDNRSHVWIYLDGAQPVFELYSEHGWLSPEGGSNVFLSTGTQPEINQAMDRPVHLRFKSKLKGQVAHYTDDDAARDGAVLWQYFSGLIFQYDGEAGPITLFMQIRHGQSTGGGRYLFAPNDGALVYGYAFPNEPQALEAVAADAALTQLDLDVNAYLCDAIRGAYPRAAGGARLTLPEAALDPARWRLTSFYIGLETQSGRLVDGVYRGAAAARVQISELYLTRDEGRPGPGCP